MAQMHSVALVLMTAATLLRASEATARFAATTLNEQAKLAGVSRGQFDNDGQAVAISGNRAIVSGDGDAYIFVRNGTAWTREATLTSGDAWYGAFGGSVALDGDTAIVGAFLDEAAHVFVRRGASWTHEARLHAVDRTTGDSFGYTVAISGNTAVVGAPDDDGQRGSAYVFVRNETSWTQQAKLVGSDGSAGDQLTSPMGLALDQNTAALGSAVKQCIYVFVRNGAAWSQQGRLVPSGDSAGFGWSLDVKGDRLVASNGDVFERVNGTWIPRGAFSTAKSSVAMHGSRIVAGERLDTGRTEGTGAAYVYKLNNGTWLEEARLIASDGAWLDIFGDAVDIDGDHAIMGAPGEATGGVAYTFSLPATAPPVQGPLRFVAVTPCRTADTRPGEGRTGGFGPPFFAAGQTREIPVPQSVCGIPSTARAYSLNVTVVPHGPLSYLSIWPAGFERPLVSTLNSFDGRVVANAAIVPAGTDGAINVFVTNPSDVILDINGYFAP
jgi:hypothetical protein